MDEKNLQETTKKTRSQARHLRRKRLIIARRSTDQGISLDNPKKILETDENSQKISENPIVSKSKARRLRKKIRAFSHTSPISSPSASLDTSENTPPNSPPTPEEIHSGNEKNPQELLNNEKNLKITESLSALQPGDSIPKLIINTSQSTKIPSPICHSKRHDISHELTLSHESSKLSPKHNDKQSILRKTISPAEINMNPEGKTREEIKAEREAKKAAKAAAKSKSKVSKQKSEASELKSPAQTPNKSLTINSTNHLQENSPKPAVKSKPHNVMSDEEVEKEILNVEKKLSELSVSDVIENQVMTVRQLQIKKQDGKSPDEGKSKAQLREERRLKQEAQRAAKEAQKKVKSTVKSVVQSVDEPKSPKPQGIEDKCMEKLDNSPRKIKKIITKENSHEVGLFKHLYHERGQAFVDTPIVNSHVHPAVVRLGVQYAEKIIVGSNARCIAFLAAIKELIEDFERPSQADFTRGLEASLQEHAAYLHHCRPMAITMHNALRHLKWQITQLNSKTSDNEAKTKLAAAIDTYIQEQILLAGKAISIAIQTKISDGDVILTCSYSSLIRKILCEAHDKGKKFRVVILDGRPFLEGRELLRRLAKHGIECSYGRITQVSNIIKKEGVSKVLLGVHAIFANGAIMSRLGTAQVALMAKAFNIPVLVACETYKTCERVQTDSIVNNEIGDPNELAIGSTALANWKAHPNLNLLNLTYDVTPPELITAVVTELGILPCTSVPVILRMKSSEI